MTPAVPPLESRPFPIAPPHFTPSPAHRRSHAPVPFNPPLGAWSGSQGGVASHLPPPRSAAAPSRDRSPFPGEGAALSRDTPHSPLSPPSPAPSPIPKTRRTTPLPPVKGRHGRTVHSVLHGGWSGALPGPLRPRRSSPPPSAALPVRPRLFGLLNQSAPVLPDERRLSANGNARLVRSPPSRYIGGGLWPVRRREPL